MGKKGDKKQMERAKFMKDHGIKRTTGKCPMGCGATIPNGGTALLSHLSRCVGKRRR